MSQKIQISDETIMEVYDRHRGNIRKTALDLNIATSTVRRRIIGLGILYKYRDESARRKKKAAEPKETIQVPCLTKSEPRYGFKKEKLDELLDIRVGKEITVLCNDRKVKRVIEAVHPFLVLTSNPRNHTKECYTKGEILMYNAKGRAKCE